MQHSAWLLWRYGAVARRLSGRAAASLRDAVHQLPHKRRLAVSGHYCRGVKNQSDQRWMYER